MICRQASFFGETDFVVFKSLFLGYLQIKLSLRFKLQILEIREAVEEAADSQALNQIQAQV